MTARVRCLVSVRLTILVGSNHALIERETHQSSMRSANSIMPWITDPYDRFLVTAGGKSGIGLLSVSP